MYSGLNQLPLPSPKLVKTRTQKNKKKLLSLYPSSCSSPNTFILHPHLANQNPTISKEGSFLCVKGVELLKEFYFFYFISEF